MKRLWIGLAALLLAAVPAFASTVIGMSVEDHARLSKHVVLGTIVSQVGIDDAEMGIETEVTIKVRHDFKRQAAAGDLVTFHIRSGEIDGVISTAVPRPSFATTKKEFGAGGNGNTIPSQISARTFATRSGSFTAIDI